MIRQSIDLLGYKVKDKVTTIEGVATSVCFDLFGCIQVAINPGLDKDGKPKESHWYDLNRIERQEGERVMPLPSFAAPPTVDDERLVGADTAAYDRGPAEKPSAKP